MLTKPLPDTHHGVDRCDHATVNGTPLISINTEYYSDIDRDVDSFTDTNRDWHSHVYGDTPNSSYTQSD